MIIEEVAAERRRQVDEEGWSPEHDDGLTAGELAIAAACYAISDQYCEGVLPSRWPWHAAWWKPKNRRRDLIRAAALIVAEIERRDRAGHPPPRTELVRGLAVRKSFQGDPTT